MGKIKHSQLLFTASALAIVAFSLPARSQQIVADGVTVEVPADTIITTQAAGSLAGSAFLTQNGGVINTRGQVNLTTSGVQAPAALSFQGGTINLNGGVVTTTGDIANGLAVNSGTLTNSGNLTIRTEGNDRANGINAFATSTVTLGGTVDIGTKGDDSIGLRSNASTVTASGPLIIRTAGNNRAHGINALNGSTVTLNGSVDIGTKGEDSIGLRSNASTVTSNGPMTIRTEGTLPYAHGIDAQSYSTLILNGPVDIATKGGPSMGLHSWASTVTSNGPLFIRTSSNDVARGIGAQAGSTVTLNGVTDIATTGDLSAGLFSNTASTVTSKGPLSIKTSGNDHSRGLDARSASVISLNGTVNVVTIGNRSQGLVSTIASKVTAIGPLSIRTSGTESHGIDVRDGSTVEIAKGDIATQGAAAAGIQTLFSGANRVSTVSIANGRLESAQGDLVRSQGGALDVTLDTMTTRNGSGLVLNVLDDAAGNHGVVNFNAIDTGLTGDILVAADNIANVSLAGSELTGAAYNATNITLDAGSVWTMTDSSTVSDTVTNAGRIAFAAPDAGVFKTLTTTNYVGDNGTVVLNATLGADASPSDRIVIDGGAAIGRTGLVVNNVAGTGAPTTDGIKLVDAINGGTTNADAFFLGNGDYVTADGQNAKVAGAYAYTLNRSTTSNGSDVYGDSYAANDWYLRSVLIDLVDPIAEPELPRYHPGVPVYETYPATLQILNRLPSLFQRMGDRYWHEQAPAAYSQDGAAIVTGNNVWGRIEGLHGHRQPDATTSRSDYDYDLWKFQAGIDGLLYESDAGKLIGGFTVHYGQVNTDVSSLFGHGGIDTSGYGFGGTLTWYGNNGFYVDAQGQLTWFDSDLSSNTLGRGLADGNDGFGYAFSLEAGQRIGLSENWTLTPQAQLTWSSVDFDSFADPYGAGVSLDRGDSLKGRLGLALGHERGWKDAGGQTSRIQIYGTVNLTTEFLDGTRVDVSGTKFDSRADRLNGGIGLGGAYSWANDKYAIYGEVSVDTSLKNFADSHEVGGKLGLRVKF